MEQLNLIERLKQSPVFTEKPLEQQEIFARLATAFDDAVDLAMYLDPTELTEKLRIGNRQMWQEFLNFEPVVQYIRAQMTQAATVASRKAFASLQKEAMMGDVGAAKQVNEIAGIFSGGDRNKVIVLHRVNRG